MSIEQQNRIENAPEANRWIDTTLPPIEIEANGVWSVYPWGTHRFAKAGRGFHYEWWMLTADNAEDLVPDGFEIIVKFGRGDPNIPEYQTMLMAQSGNIQLVMDRQVDSPRIQFALSSLDIAAESKIRTLAATIKSKVSPPPDTPDDSITGYFWRMTPTGPATSVRRLAVPDWSDIRNNYAENAQSQIESLHAYRPTDGLRNGNLIVLHGPAGTGKTTALRSLAKAWKPWADLQYVVDPDNFLGYPDYLWQTVLSSSEDSRWKLIVMEDVDELIRTGAKSQVGQSFSRLLNLGDGFLGQGLRILIVLTTNEPIDNLAPAIKRPGRCLAHIEVPALSAVQASKWLGQNHEEATLAELYEVRSSKHQLVSESSVIVPGQYL